jgi:hypothetical protein
MENETKGGGREREKECFVFAESGTKEKMNYLGSLSDIYILSINILPICPSLTPQVCLSLVTTFP